MRFSSIKSRLTLLFVSFALLVTISAGVMFRGINAQKQDALVINLAGRQRMLVQQMTRLALEIERDQRADEKLELQESMNAFEGTLNALRDGGPAPYLAGMPVTLPPAGDPAIIHSLDQVAQSWGPFRDQLLVVQSANASSPEFQTAVHAIERSSLELVQLTDQVVRQFESHSLADVERLRWVQITFLVAALSLLALGGLLTQRSVIEPLRRLRLAAKGIGRGDLESPVQVPGPGEIQVLGETFENMRSQLNASRQQAQAWTESLEQRVAQRTRELEALYTVSREISSRLDINYVLRSVTDKACQLLGGEVAYLCLLDENGGCLNLQATSGPAEAVRQSVSSTASQFTGQILSAEGAQLAGLKSCQGFCAVMQPRYRTSHVAAPLRLGSRTIGALCVGSTQADAFSTEAVELLTKLASATAVALENARLYEQAERSAVLEERQRLAAEMHDSLAQTLSYLHMMVDLACEQVEEGKSGQALETLGRGRVAIEQANLETRQAIASLQQEFPRRNTLQEQLEELANAAGEQGQPVLWECKIQAPILLAADQSEQVLRVAREALLNAQKHGAALTISLSLHVEGEAALLRIQDDGRGFDPQSQPSGDGRRHFGLSIMRARAARLGGELEIRSTPGQGTCVTLRWPLASAAQAESARVEGELPV